MRKHMKCHEAINMLVCDIAKFMVFNRDHQIAFRFHEGRLHRFLKGVPDGCSFLKINFPRNDEYFITNKLEESQWNNS